MLKFVANMGKNKFSNSVWERSQITSVTYTEAFGKGDGGRRLESVRINVTEGKERHHFLTLPF